MSDVAARTPRRVRDAGMTLPELLIAVLVTGMLVAVMASATQVVLGQQRDNVGRINNTRSEQAIGTWLPSDLASAESVDTDPGASPCGTQCPAGIDVSGSNTLMLSWHGWVAGDTSAQPSLHTVSYRYVEHGGVYDIIRVACVSVNGAAPTCSQVTVLHDVPAPPAGEDYRPGITSPTWVMLVSMAADPADTSNGGAPGSDPTYTTKNGRRVTVTINGGGSAAGTGQDQITLTAGGVDRVTNLSTTDLSATPTFAATRSRCGGNLGLVVDTSGSIGSNMTSVRNGVTAFVDAFAGTPVKLQVVSFASTATTLGAGGTWSKYYDMLVDTDVAALKTAVAALSSGGYTNYEDAFFRMFRNSDGTVQEQLPNTLVFFTDGVPTYNRLSATTASAAATASSEDGGLPAASTNGAYNQVSWNRANRVLRTFDADLQKLVGVFVGADVSGSSTWLETGAGYHLDNFEKGYHSAYERGYRLVSPLRGYHGTYQYAASGVTYYYAGSGVTYQYSTSGLTFEVSNTGLTYEYKGATGTWAATTKATYDANNTTNDSTDSYRVRVTGTVGTTWSTTTKALYDASNSTSDAVDGYRMRVTGTVGTGWSTTTKALFDLTNTSNGSTDGYRVVVGTPGTWTATTKAYYDLNNVVAGNTDGYYVAATGTLGTWTTTTKDYYDANNTLDDATDGFKLTKYYTSPFSEWEATTDAAYLAGNTTADNTDGWDATVSYTAPFSYWSTTTASTYAANNTTADSTDGWRISKLYSSPFDSWETATEAEYNAGNTVWGNTDGWNAAKVYASPYTLFESATSSTRTNTDILKSLVAPGGVVPALQSGGRYTNAAEATYYELPAWDQFAGAMTSMALAECGGTVTVQTKVGTASAADPFTYQNSIDRSTATTSTTYRSGTFDFALSGGASVSTTIAPLDTSTLTHYRQIGWTCKAGGVDYPFTTTPMDGGWTKITLTVSPNQAISCVNQVAVK